MINSFEEIIAIDDRKLVTFAVPSWNNEQVYIRPLTSEQAEKVLVKFSGVKENKNEMVGTKTVLVRMSLCDSQGTLLISNDEQAKMLGEKSSAAMTDIFEFCMTLNGFKEEASEEIEKN